MKKGNGLLALPLALAACLLALPSMAKEKPEWRNGPFGERFYGSISYYKPELRTQAAVSDSEGNLGALISFEDTLGLSDSKGTTLASFGWRISKRNSLSANYFKLDHSATQDSTIGYFLDTDPPTEGEVTLPLSAVFNIESFDITYAFSAIANEKHNLAIGLGLAVQDLEFGYQPSSECDVEAGDLCSLVEPRSAKATAPLPTLKLIYQYAITEKWIVAANVGYFALSLELDDKEDLSGQIWDIGAIVRWKTWEHVGFNFGYKFFDVDFDYKKRDLIAAADYDYRGFALGIEAYY